MTKNFSRIDHIQDPNPIARYHSGLTLYEEALIDTRWIGQYFSTIARINTEPLLPQHVGVDPVFFHRAFGLEIDGQSLHRNWKFVDSQNCPHCNQTH